MVPTFTCGLVRSNFALAIFPIPVPNPLVHLVMVMGHAPSPAIDLRRAIGGVPPIGSA
jgi:hypothetical protein